MKTLKILIIISLTLSLYSCKSDNPKEIISPKTQLVQKANKVELIDFHTKHRCKACISIEANTKETLETYFAEDLKSGKLVFRLINADKSENEQIVEDYEAYGTSLFINVIKDGKETHIDLTNFAFKTEPNKEKFISELKEKIDNELKNI